MVALNGSGCGGGDDRADDTATTTAAPMTTAESTTTTSPPPAPAATLADWSAEASRLCRENAASFGDEEPGTADAYLAAVQEAVAKFGTLQERLRALPVPPEQAARIEQYLAYNDQQLEVLRRVVPDLEAAAAGDDLVRAEQVLEPSAFEFGRLAGLQDPFASELGVREACNAD